MPSMFLRYILLFILSLSFSGFGQTFTERRIYQLDSAISVMDKKLVKDFHKSHHYLDSVGQTDAEKAWLFYAYVVCHFKYDHVRFKESSKVSKEYTVEYTSYKTSGVCRDFAKLYEGMCRKSNIPCLSVIGKSKVPFFLVIQKVKSFFEFINHQWNVVRLDNEWFLVDPTWGSIEKTEKVTYLDKKKQKHFIKISHPSKNYFCSEPAFFVKTHLPTHPAFYCSNNAPAFKRYFKRNQFKKTTLYNYNSFLNEMWNQKYPYLFTKLRTETFDYKKKLANSVAVSFLFNEVQELIGPKAPTYPFKLADYKKTQERWKEIEKICNDSLQSNVFSSIQYKYKKDIFKLLRKLEKQDAEEKKAAEKKKPKAK